ncbi:MAG: hypothetical protein IJ474_04770, partial [Mailhella sp.]|nr:hypothetical protein [Mailhella sp.]
MGFVDVSMNTQAIQIERAYFRPCVSMMHASYSIGGVLGSIAGALFAGLGASTLMNFSCVLALYLALYPLALPYMQAELPQMQKSGKASSSRIPLFVLLCGLLSTVAYSAEGSVAEWGSLLLFTVKGSSEFTAALVFGAFCTTMVTGRLVGDRLRCMFGDFPLLLSGASLAFAGMLTVLLSPWAALCLFGYALMGLGLAHRAHLLQSCREHARHHSGQSQCHRFLHGLQRRTRLSALAGLAGPSCRPWNSSLRHPRTLRRAYGRGLVLPLRRKTRYLLGLFLKKEAP